MSDVLAFVFVFSIIITSVGIVSAFGFRALQDIQGDEQANNAVRGMESLGHNLGNVQRGHAPGRTGELKLSNGKIYVRENSEISVTVDCGGGAPPPGCDSTFDFDMGTLYYDMESRDTNVTYENGAVFREDRGGSPLVVDGPRFICGDDYAVVSVVTLVSDAGAPGGGGTVQVIGREQETKLHFANDSVDTVRITVQDSRFDEGWVDYFQSDDNEWTVSSTSPPIATCDVGSDGKVFVRRTIIDIDFIT
ncbi:hypothetical protein BRD00_11245 [Halobacteriales archaeon QS_8_69_26]|nr:MAG: hypothetical protein BRD00_11245 [Halobacteriales archaeon QS_8_69_26]